MWFKPSYVGRGEKGGVGKGKSRCGVVQTKPCRHWDAELDGIIIRLSSGLTRPCSAAVVKITS